MLALFLCMFYLSSPVLAEVLTEGLTCPAYWLYLNGSCYRAYSTDQSWFDAEKLCRENQGELLSINSEAEQRLVYQHMAINKTLWIGLVKDRSLGSFRWSNGERLTYENWIPGEGNVSGSEDCDALSGRYFKRLPRTRLTGHVISQVNPSSDMECLLWCYRNKKCTSVNNRPGDSRSTNLCELNAATAEDFPGDLTDSGEFDYYEYIV
ncbi:snaclec 5-like isoform X2 [Oculina patagonica]